MDGLLPFFKKLTTLFQKAYHPFPKSLLPFSKKLTTFSKAYFPKIFNLVWKMEYAERK